MSQDGKRGRHRARCSGAENQAPGPFSAGWLPSAAARADRRHRSGPQGGGGDGEERVREHDKVMCPAVILRRS